MAGFTITSYAPLATGMFTITDLEDGLSVEMQYSVDGTTWHAPPLTSSDRYMRQRLGAEGTWTSAVKIVADVFRSKGTWASGTAYVSSDTSMYIDTVIHNGATFYCKVSHTSTAGNGPSSADPPVDNTNWGVMSWRGAQGPTGTQWRNRGPWVSTLTYYNSSTYIDLVNFNGSLFASKINNNIGNQPPLIPWGDAKWDLVVARDTYPRTFSWVKSTGATIAVSEDANKGLWKNGTSTGWDGGAYSDVGVTGECILSFTVLANTKAFMIGLNRDPLTDHNYTSIDYAFYITADAKVDVYESGTSATAGARYGSYAIGDKFHIYYDGASTIKYYQNGVLLKTTTTALVKPRFYIDASFSTAGATSAVVSNIMIEQYGAPNLDWIQDWDGTKVMVGQDYVLTPRMFAGIVSNPTSATPSYTGIAIGRDVFGSGNSTIGIAGYVNKTATGGVKTFHINSDGTAVFGTNTDRQFKVNADGSVVMPKITTSEISATFGQDLVIANNNAITELAIGSTNIIRNSNAAQGSEFMQEGPTTTFLGRNCFVRKTTGTTEVFLRTQRYEVEAGATYSLSFDATYSGPIKSFDVYMLTRKVDSVADWDYAPSKTSVALVANQWGRYKWEGQVLAGDAMDVYIRFDNNGSNTAGTEAALYITNIKFEKNAKVTAWSLAPEDIVDPTSIISAIRLSSETAKIQASKIDLQGAVTIDSFEPNTLGPLFSANPSTGQIEINGNLITRGSVTAEQINALGLTVQAVINGITQDTFVISSDEASLGKVSIKGDVQSFDYVSGSTGWRIDSGGSAEFNNTVVRGRVELPLAGMTNENLGSTADDKVRIWAGSSYANRKTAPFVVLEDGTVKATKGQFGGTFSGELHIGNVHIVDNNNSDASIEVKTNGDTQTLISFKETQSFIDTKFIIGNEASTYFVVNNDNNEVHIHNNKLHISQFGSNLVTNSHIKDGITGWTLSTGWSRDTTTKFKDYNTFKCVVTGLAANEWRGVFSNYTTVTVGEVLTASMYIYIPTAHGIDQGAAMEIEWYDATTRLATTAANFSTVAGNLNKWVRYTTTGTAPAGTVKARLRTHPTRNGSYWAALFQLERGSVLTPWGLESSETRAVSIGNRIDGHLIDFKDDQYNFDMASDNSFLLQSNSTASVDFKFKKESSANAVNVEVDGALTVNNFIKMGKVTIQKKTDAGNQGIDFIIT